MMLFQVHRLHSFKNPWYTIVQFEGKKEGRNENDREGELKVNMRGLERELFGKQE
jgi:hypothetical protein